MTFRRKGRAVYRLWVSIPKRPRQQLSTGTTLLRVAKRMEALVDTLKQERQFALLTAVLDGRLTLGDLYDADRTNTLPRLIAGLKDVDLFTQLDAWQAALKAKGKPSPDSCHRYQIQVRDLLGPAPFSSADFTRVELEKRIRALSCASPTKRRYLAALQSFAKYLRRSGVIDWDPFIDMDRPQNSSPRMVWYAEPELVKLIGLALPRYRGLIALVQGTGADRSAAFRVRRRDVDVKRRMVYLRGTKTEYRARWAPCDEWAWRPVEAAAKGLLPDALLFANVTYAGLRSHWERLVKLAGLDGYRLHDARHSFAVRWLEAGIDPAKVGHWLGHRDGSTVMRVYSRQIVTPADYERVKANRVAK